MSTTTVMNHFVNQTTTFNARLLHEISSYFFQNRFEVLSNSYFISYTFEFGVFENGLNT